jgi:O-acetyl-ADP-ribose deacetylase (regulator of RNase III)
MAQLLHITVIQGSILEVEAQAIVNAANSLGVMGGGVAGVIRRAAGEEVEAEARRQAPITVGQAVLTSGGRTKFRGIIHAPTMTRSGERIPPDNVALAVRAALALADEQGFESVALPGMGTGVGGVAHASAALRMIGAIKAHVPHTIRSVILVDVDPEMVAAWREALK